jgi:hypothetical protein
MKIDGHCHCGEITFEAEVDPTALTICHCTDCQTITGSAFRANITAPAEHFVLKSGTAKTYVKTAGSGNKRPQAFCGTCGRSSGLARSKSRRAIPYARARSRSAQPSRRGGAGRTTPFSQRSVCDRCLAPGGCTLRGRLLISSPLNSARVRVSNMCASP